MRIQIAMAERYDGGLISAGGLAGVMMSAILIPSAALAQIAGPPPSGNNASPAGRWINFPSYEAYFDQGPNTICGLQALPPEVGAGFSIPFGTGPDACNSSWAVGDAGGEGGWTITAFISTSQDGNPIENCSSTQGLTGSYAGGGPGVNYFVDGLSAPVEANDRHLKKDPTWTPLRQALKRGECILPSNTQLYFNVRVESVRSPLDGYSGVQNIGVGKGRCVPRDRSAGDGYVQEKEKAHAAKTAAIQAARQAGTYTKPTPPTHGCILVE